MQKALIKSTSFIRKAIALMLVSLYILFSVGVIKATHFCMGREASVRFFSSEADKCPCSLYAAGKSSCCDDQHELLRIDDEQKIISAISAPLPVWKVERIFTERLLAFDVASLIPPLEEATKAPPKIPIWKATSCYVFYDGSDSDKIG